MSVPWTPRSGNHFRADVLEEDIKLPANINPVYRLHANSTRRELN